MQSSHGTQIHLALRWGLSFALNPPVELVTPRGWEEPTGSSLKNNNNKKIRTKKNIKMKMFPKAQRHSGSIHQPRGGRERGVGETQPPGAPNGTGPLEAT